MTKRLGVKMRIVDILAKKRDGEKLSPAEIERLVQGFVAGDVADYQMSAFLMAAYIKGLDDVETFALTQAMAGSGSAIDLSEVEGIKVDKHSTGGVGDKVTLILAPMMAAVGLKVAKMSGRGLGHTGGTLDKLESIPGFRVDLSQDQFINQVNDIGLAIIGQTAEVCPADKRMYALRDVTATVSNIPLIVSSIMSKKIAGGADAIVFDVKAGSGALVKTLDEARMLAEKLVATGKRFDKKVVAVISNMDQPLGSAVGNSLEVEEAVDVIRGNGPADVIELCYTLGSNLMVAAGRASSIQEAVEQITDAIESGAVFEKFHRFIEAQGGDPRVADHPRDFLPHARYVEDIELEVEGYVRSIDAEKIGVAAHTLGAGREKMEDAIDHGAGIFLLKKVGDYVRAGDTLVQMHAGDAHKFNAARPLIEQAFLITDIPHAAPEIIYDIIT